MLIGIDFDHTIVHGDKPIAGVKDALHKIRDAGHKILIHSCNGSDWIKKVMDQNELPYDYIWNSSEHDKGKPVCAAYIDDRAVAFDGDWDKALQDLHKLLTKYTHPSGLF
jgi:hypothetical protein